MRYCFLLAFMSLLGFSGQAESVTFEALLDEMVDRDALAKTPEHPFKLEQASSYDRASKSPTQGWFANGDGGGFIRTENNQGRSERVLMDVQGPGAVVRFWSTFLTWQFSNGTLRFYLDGSDTPQIEGKFHDIIHGTKLVDGILADTTGGFMENNHILAGRNLYLPIPYAKGCKITYEGTDNPFYFAINYRKYVEGTDVKTFAMSDLRRNRGKLVKVQEELVDSVSVTKNTEHVAIQSKAIQPGQSAQIAGIDGTRAIRQLALQLEADNHDQALRSTVIEISFDGQQSVWAPVGDFFATGYRLSPFESRYHSVAIDGTMQCRWVMPFQTAAKITIHNHGEEAVTVRNFKAHHSAWQWDERSLYFHAAWRVYSEIPTAPKSDANYITLKGKGHYVGDSLAIFNASSGQEGQPWWGEGDEKIYIDGEAFPSQFGTGTEDYYGYAWVGCAAFGTPFLSQPIAQGNRGRGLTVNGRWRMLDTMPFSESLKLDMEIWSWVDGITLDYAPTTFWYAPQEGGAKAVLNLTTGEAMRNDVEGVKRAVRTVGPIEVEGMQVTLGRSGESYVQTYPKDSRLSNRSYWMVRGIKRGDQASASFFSANAVEGELKITTISTPSGATVDILLNGKMLLQGINLNGNGVTPTTYDAGSVVFKQGKNQLAVHVVDDQGGEFGIDKIQLIPAHVAQ